MFYVLISYALRSLLKTVSGRIHGHASHLRSFVANVLHMPQDVLQLCIDSLTVGDKFMVHGSISGEKTINMLVVTLMI